MGLMNGLSALGAGVAQFAGNAGLELQKSQLAQQQAILADQLATNRELNVTQPFQKSQLEASEAGANTRNAATNATSITTNAASNATSLATNALNNATSRSNNAATIAAEAARQQAGFNAPTETEKLFKFLGINPDGSSKASGTAAPSSAPATDASPTPSDGTVASTPSASGTAPPSADPMANPIVRKALGLGPAGSEQDVRMAVAKDVSTDPNWKYKPIGQQAAEIEHRLAVAKGTMTDDASQDELAMRIASYQKAPLDNMALTKGGMGEAMAKAFKINPDYQEARYPEINKAMSAFGSGKQGDIVRALDVGVQHLDVFDQAAAALKNGDIQKLNSMGNYFAQQFGAAAPTTLDGLKQLVATEIEKSVAGGIGSAGDRDRLVKSLDGANSPAQLQAMTNGFRSLMTGQLNGLKTQYEAATDFKSGPFAFEKKLSPDTLKVLSRHGGGETATPGTPASDAQAPLGVGATDGGFSPYALPSRAPGLPPGFRIVQ